MTDVINTLQGAAFDELYTREIEPELSLQEVARREAVQAFALVLVAGLLLVVVEGLMLHSMAHAPGYVPPMQLVAATIISAAYLGYLPIRKVSRAAKTDVINALCKPLNIHYSERLFDPPELQTFGALNMLPGFRTSRFEDHFSGARGERQFELCEAILVQGTGRNRRTVFRGQLFRISFPRAFEGTTVVLRNSGWLNRFVCPAGLQKVGLEDPRFSEVFAVFSSDQVGARVVLTPTAMEQLVGLETAFAGAHLRFAFSNSDVLIAIEGGNRFEIGNLFSTLVDRRRVDGIAGDLSAVFRLIDSFPA